MLCLLALFSNFAFSIPISSVIQGNWTFRTILPSKQEEDTYNFEIVYTLPNIHNYLTTTLNGDLVQINVSFVDLSGNITYQDNLYDFNFTMKARPYISTDIDFGEFGITHCSFSSYSSMHCVWVYQNETFSLYGERADFETAKSDWIHKNGKNAILIVLGIGIFFGFQYATKMLQQNYAEELRNKQELEKLQAEEKKKNEKEDENSTTTTPEDAAEEQMQSAEQTNEESNQPQEKLPEPDPDHKIKTD